LITIVALVIAMMQLVIKRSQRQSAFISNKQIFIASMGHRRFASQALAGIFKAFVPANVSQIHVEISIFNVSI
jgi:hypothetical protein